MKKPRQTGIVPHGGYWRFVDPDTHQEVKHPYYTMVKARAHAARVKAGFPIPFNFDEWFADIVCQSTPGACYDVADKPQETESSSWFKLSIQFATAMVQWAKAGFPTVTWDEFKRRSEICAGSQSKPRCDQYQASGTFGLARCGKCGCSKLKLYLGTSKCPLSKW